MAIGFWSGEVRVGLLILFCFSGYSAMDFLNHWHIELNCGSTEIISPSISVFPAPASSPTNQSPLALWLNLADIQQ